MPRLLFTWNTSRDARVCPRCQPLEGRVWTFLVGRDAFPDMLTAEGVIVWDLVADEPRTHGAHPYRCRCTLTWRSDLTDIRERLLALVGVVEQWRGVGLVRVVRREGQFVTWSREP